ncbi:hypothetical protein AAE478_005414 [Parahypoxylon ruwenzoriense]
MKIHHEAAAGTPANPEISFFCLLVKETLSKQDQRNFRAGRSWGGYACWCQGWPIMAWESRESGLEKNGGRKDGT